MDKMPVMLKNGLKDRDEIDKEIAMLIQDGETARRDEIEKLKEDKAIAVLAFNSSADYLKRELALQQLKEGNKRFQENLKADRNLKEQVLDMARLFHLENFFFEDREHVINNLMFVFRVTY